VTTFVVNGASKATSATNSLAYFVLKLGKLPNTIPIQVSIDPPRLAMGSNNRHTIFFSLTILQIVLLDHGAASSPRHQDYFEDSVSRLVDQPTIQLTLQDEPFSVNRWSWRIDVGSLVKSEPAF
jgi:hypothetical protein